MSQYPHGKLNEDDGGSTPVKIGVKNKRVIIQFETPMLWLGLDRGTALMMAEALKKHAESLETH